MVSLIVDNFLWKNIKQYDMYPKWISFTEDNFSFDKRFPRWGNFIHIDKHRSRKKEVEVLSYMTFS